MPRQHPPECRRAAVELAERAQPRAALAKGLGPERLDRFDALDWLRKHSPDLMREISSRFVLWNFVEVGVAVVASHGASACYGHGTTFLVHDFCGLKPRCTNRSSWVLSGGSKSHYVKHILHRQSLCGYRGVQPERA